MLYLVLLIALFSLIFLPQIWVKWVLHQNNKSLAEIPGDGEELAVHLIERFKLDGIKVETTDQGDHYSPEDNTVRLNRKHANKNSLTSVAIAAHEVGHAIQFNRKEKITELYLKYLPLANIFQKLGVGIFIVFPLIALLVKIPSIMIFMFALSLLLQFIGALLYLLILPMEYDASFNKALPILIEGNYITEEQSKAVKQILSAAAWTYFAGALASILNIARWLLILRR